MLACSFYSSDPILDRTAVGVVRNRRQRVGCEKAKIVGIVASSQRRQVVAVGAEH
jgi:hypothetical protein